MTGDLPVDPNQVRDPPHLPGATLALAILAFIASPYVIVLSFFAAMAGSDCSARGTCDDIDRWWGALNVAAWAMPAVTIVALLGARAARSTTGRVLWTLAIVVPPVVWLAILVNVPT